jgi:hypothetical protein
MVTEELSESLQVLYSAAYLILAHNIYGIQINQTQFEVAKLLYTGVTDTLESNHPRETLRK